MYDVATGIAFHEARGTFIVAASSNRIGEWDPVRGTWTELSSTKTSSDSDPDAYDVCVEEVIYLPNKRRAFTRCSNSYAHDFEIDVETNTWYQTLDNSQPHPASPYIGQYLTVDTLRNKVSIVSRSI